MEPQLRVLTRAVAPKLIGLPGCPVGQSSIEDGAVGAQEREGRGFDWHGSRCLADLAESALCNVTPLAHFTDFPKWLRQWLDDKHRIYPDGPDAYVAPARIASGGSAVEKGDATSPEDATIPQKLPNQGVIEGGAK